MKTIKSILEESKKLKKEVSDAVLKRKEELYVELKKKRKEFEDRYGEDADKVMHATAMNMAKKEMSEEELQRRTMKDFEDHTPKEDDPAAYHKLVTKSGKRIADKDELDEGKKRYNIQLNVGKAKYAISFHDGKKKHNDGSDFFDMRIFKNKLDLKKYEKELKSKGYVKEEVELDEANLKTVEKDVKKILSKVRINNKVSKQGNKFVVTITPDDEKDAQKALKNHPLYVAGKLRVMTEEVELDEALNPKDKKVIDAFYNGKSMDGKMLWTDGKKLEKTGMGGQTIAVLLVGGKFKILAKIDSRSTQDVVKYIEKSFPKNVIEEVELDEALSSSLIKKLKKQYEPLRDKKVSLDNLKKMSSMIEKFGKEELIQLVKADIPFISQSAHTALMYKHNMSVSQIKKMKNEKVRFEDLVKKAADNLSELNWLVDLQGIGKVVIDGSSKGEVLASLRKKLKNVDDIGDIERMTDTDKKKYFKMKYATVGKKEPEDKEIKEALDKELVTELSMFILNDAHIYKRRILPVIKNMKRKVASGKFDKKLAIKAFSAAVTDGIKKYSQTFDVVKPSRQDKEEIAKTLYDHYQTAIMEFDDKYKEIYNKLNEDNQERIDFMLNDDKEYDKVLEFVSQFQ
jgi:hypothetical protein